MANEEQLAILKRGGRGPALAGARTRSAALFACWPARLAATATRIHALTAELAGLRPGALSLTARRDLVGLLKVGRPLAGMPASGKPVA